MRLGIHLYTFGSLGKAAARAAEIGADTLQIFTASPRMWRPGTLRPEEVMALKAVRDQHGIGPLVVHVNYLVNLASSDPLIRAQSIRTLSLEFERAAAVGAEFLVVHPGSRKEQSVEAAVRAIAEGIVESARGSRGVTLLLENTAGSGSSVGSRFEELDEVRRLAVDRSEAAIGYCLDTCHLFAAGFDIATAAGLGATLREAEEKLGLEHVHVIHANDSKAPLGSRVDRHAKIGHGHIGKAAFRRLLARRELRRMAVISETPVEQDGDEQRNMDTLREVAGARGAGKALTIPRRKRPCHTDC